MRYAYVPESDVAHEAQLAALRADIPGPVVQPPRVRARAPQGPAEFADKRQAGTLGRLALGRGWRAKAWYWQAADGTETCCLQLEREPLRAVVTWTRAPGVASWASGVAYGWRTDLERIPENVGHRRLSELIKMTGEA
jgi:hypothetical protein